MVLIVDYTSGALKQSSRLAISAYMYKEEATSVKAQKLQLQFIQMVQKPLAIKAKPYFVLDYAIFVNVRKEKEDESLLNANEFCFRFFECVTSLRQCLRSSRRIIIIKLSAIR